MAGPAPAAEIAVSRPRKAELGQLLTERELEVLDLISQGLSSAEAGARLFLAEDTIKTHVYRAMIKLGAVNRTHAVRLAFEQGVLGGPRPARRDPVEMSPEEFEAFKARWRAANGDTHRVRVLDVPR